MLVVSERGANAKEGTFYAKLRQNLNPFSVKDGRSRGDGAGDRWDYSLRARGVAQRRNLSTISSVIFSFGQAFFRKRSGLQVTAKSGQEDLRGFY